jgi:hypothetical protein
MRFRAWLLVVLAFLLDAWLFVLGERFWGCSAAILFATAIVWIKPKEEL